MMGGPDVVAPGHEKPRIRMDPGQQGWRWGELNPRPTVNHQGFSGRSSASAFLGPSTLADTVLTGSVTLSPHSSGNTSCEQWLSKRR